MSTIRICSSDKKTFLNASDAWKRLCDLRTLGRRTGNTYYPIRVYECPECGGWHLTSRPNRY